MSTFTGQVWLGSSSGRQEISVNSNTWHGAREQIKTIYGVKDGDIWNLQEVSSRSASSASGGGSVSLGDSIKFVGGIIGLGVVGVGAFITWAILPVVLSLVALILAYKYTSKFTQGKNFHVRFWLVLILTVGTPVAAFNTGTAIWNATGYTNNTAISE